VSGLSDLYDYSIHDLDALLAREGLAIRVVPLSLSSSPVGGFSPPTPGLPAGDGDLSTECTA
jgi:hypothetical protein